MRKNITLSNSNFSIPEFNYSRAVTTPYTWNVDDNVMKHRGEAVYKTSVLIDNELQGKKIYICFNAIYHSASIYINDILVGEHKGSGYTPFRFDITDQITIGKENAITVVVDNTHINEMLPHMNDFDWADDGGIIRKAELLFIEKDGIEFLHIDEKIESIHNGTCDGKLNITTAFADGSLKDGVIRIVDYKNNHVVIEQSIENIENQFSINFENLKLWSSSAPNLYKVFLETDTDTFEARIGLRKIETKNSKIFLNNEEIYLKGCEWMPGSHPDHGMAEPFEHSVKCLSQLKDSGCVFTRFHWQQDESLFDWCDENGLLVQEEIPYWGYPKESTPLQLEIAKKQADEMVYFHKNHPSIIFWGVGNELNGASEDTIDYVKKMVDYFKSKDSRRLVNYVSNTVSLDKNIDNDDATLHGDIAMWNDYLGLWEPCDDVEGHIIRTAKKCEDKALIVTEFGLCEPHFKGGDEKRCEILKERLEMYSRVDNIRGYVWFSLNDYRTHVGEQGEDKMRQRVHGSTDLYGNEKPSFHLFTKLQTT